MGHPDQRLAAYPQLIAGHPDQRLAARELAPIRERANTRLREVAPAQAALADEIRRGCAAENQSHTRNVPSIGFGDGISRFRPKNGVNWRMNLVDWRGFYYDCFAYIFLRGLLFP